MYHATVSYSLLCSDDNDEVVYFNKTLDGEECEYRTIESGNVYFLISL